MPLLFILVGALVCEYKWFRRTRDMPTREDREYQAAVTNVTQPAGTLEDGQEDAEELYLDGDPFESAADMTRAAADARQAALIAVNILSSQVGDLSHWIYPNGTAAIATSAERHCGLALESSDTIGEFVVHREFGNGALDVVIFSGQPRTTLVAFTADAARRDVAIGLRARKLLNADIDWCLADMDLEP